MSNSKKFLDYEGVQYLWSKINMNDCSNNEMLMAVVNTKVDKIDGKELSTNDFTDEYKEKLDSLENVDYGTENAGKLLYVGMDGFATVLALGPGLKIVNGTLTITQQIATSAICGQAVCGNSICGGI